MLFFSCPVSGTRRRTGSPECDDLLHCCCCTVSQAALCASRLLSPAQLVERKYPGGRNKQNINAETVAVQAQMPGSSHSDESFFSTRFIALRKECKQQDWKIIARQSSSLPLLCSGQRLCLSHDF